MMTGTKESIGELNFRSKKGWLAGASEGFRGRKGQVRWDSFGLMIFDLKTRIVNQQAKI